MAEYLTTHQVQDLLKVDRITVYRMLQDGRLKGVKIGQQWRFHQQEVERLIGAPSQPQEAVPAVQPGANFPTHCVQTIQDLFAEVSQISAVVVDMSGEPLTRISRPTRFCQLLMSSPSGIGACQAGWRSFAQASAQNTGGQRSKFFTCPAGLQYVGAPIFEKETQVGLFLAGQFYWQAPDSYAVTASAVTAGEEDARIRRLAGEHNLSLAELQSAAREIPVIAPEQHARVEAWPFTAALAVESILRERLCFIERLQQIANLSHL